MAAKNTIVYFKVYFKNWFLNPWFEVQLEGSGPIFPVDLQAKGSFSMNQTALAKCAP